MTHPALASGRAAVITGAASGIGLAVAKRLAARGMRICLADLVGADLDAAAAAVVETASAGERDVMAVAADVADPAALEHLRDAVLAGFGEIGLLMNNAVTRVGGPTTAPLEDWHRAVDVNLWGVLHGVRAFLPTLLGQGGPAMIVNAGSKQGITNPPGNAAYNMTKAALKSYTESLQHELRSTRECQVTAHLLIPGFTTTGKRARKPGAWRPSQVADFMLEGLERGDFYILCPDNEVTTAMDHDRIKWAAGDITENRPPLSRWHPEWKAAFEKAHG